ncbi:MAG: hypothetical protein L0Z70_02505 [Chloroflexi bacterium]|nr:hypothetical protein [Chloroflexota bacterium]
MNPPEHLYRALVALYPARHRRAYQELMLTHARDLGREAQRRGGWHVAALCARLAADGLANAAKEHLEAFMSGNRLIHPAPWSIILLAAIPGLLFTLSRQSNTNWAIFMAAVNYGYLAMLLFGLPYLWWKQKRFPLWGLLPSGMLFWFAVYFSGTGLASLFGALAGPNAPRLEQIDGIALLQFLLAAGLFAWLLPGRRIPRSAWVVFGLIAAVSLISTYQYSVWWFGAAQPFSGILMFLTRSGIGPLEGLMLVAAGLLAARRYGVMALLFVLGGSAYMCMDSDYLFLSSNRDWAGMDIYIAAVTFIYLVVSVVAMLRARSTTGRAAALFLPALVFHAARLSVAMLVNPPPQQFSWGDLALSVNLLLSFLLAWTLYRGQDEAALVSA